MVIVDTSAVLAYVNARDPRHDDCVPVIAGADEDLVLSPYVIAELDYLVLSRGSVAEEVSVLREIRSGAWTLADFGANDVERAVAVIERYADQEIGLTDASLVVLADRCRTRTIATLDRRHFDAVRPLTGGRFRLLP